jgi:nucleoside-diphosphate-sugar epimerase
MRAVLVTGGAGYIGSHTCKVLAEAGFLPLGMTRGESKVLLAEYAKTAGYIFWHGIFPVGP